MAHSVLSLAWQEAERQAAEASAAYAAAIDAGRIFSPEELEQLKALRGDADAKLRALVAQLQTI